MSQSEVRAALLLLCILPLCRAAHAQCPDGSPPPCGRLRASLDTARYAILPFTHTPGGEVTGLDGADCAELLMEAFERWAEVRLADNTRIYDALARRGARVPFRISIDTGLAIARQLGAGKLVMGRLWTFADTLRVTAGLYDAAQEGALLRQVTTRVPLNGARLGAGFNALADSLLGATTGPGRGRGADLTSSLRALRAYNVGKLAIREWDLGRAAGAFRTAIAADPEFAHAYLDLGQALLWSADSTPEAARDRALIARRATDVADRLGQDDRELLIAQQAMSERRWPDACTAYRDILTADSTSFAAWYGLAECNAGDPVVIRDPRDTTRFVFRGSWHTAVLAYRRALLLAPSFNFAFGGRATERLAHLLLVERHWWRTGRLDDVLYYAFPALEADTIAFYATSGGTIAGSQARPATQRRALERNRQILIDVAAAWATAFPREPRAHRTLAYGLEVSGRIAPLRGEPLSALAEIEAAQRLERNRRDRMRDVVTRIRLFLKIGDFTNARRVADSLLRDPRRHTTGVAGVAVLLGRPALAARLLAPEDSNFMPAAAGNEPVRLPVSAMRTGLSLLAYAAVGAPRDSIESLEGRAERDVLRLAPADREGARSALLDAAAELAFDNLGPRRAHRPPPAYSREMEMQWGLARGDTAFVRANLDTVLAGSAAPAADEVSADAVYERSWLLAAIGDTAAAEGYLDGTLEDLPDTFAALFDYVPLAGGLARTMVLRADLAALRGRPETARRWAGAVVTLWSGAEPALQPTVARMERILAATR